MEIRECKTEDEIKATYPVLKQMYEIPQDDYMEHVAEMMETGYRLIGIFESGKCIGLSGFEIKRRLYCGKNLQIHNICVDKEFRGKRIGAEMIDWLKEEAYRNKCDTVLADTYIDNKDAQEFLKKQGLYTRGLHMKCDNL